MAQGETFIRGRSKRNAVTLLAAAAELKLDKNVVRTQLGGYMVPDEVAERYEALVADLDKAETDRGTEPAKKTTARKTAAKTTTAKKTAAKKTTAKSAAPKE